MQRPSFHDITNHRKQAKLVFTIPLCYKAQEANKSGRLKTSVAGSNDMFHGPQMHDRTTSIKPND